MGDTSTHLPLDIRLGAGAGCQRWLLHVWNCAECETSAVASIAGDSVVEYYNT